MRKEVTVVVWDTYHHTTTGSIWYTWIVNDISENAMPVGCVSIGVFRGNEFSCRVVVHENLALHFKDMRLAREIAEKHRDNYLYWRDWRGK